MNKKGIIDHLVNWLKNYSEQSGTNGFVVGISGGIDSALTSTLCALTQKPVLALRMPIRQLREEDERGDEHVAWLKKKFNNVRSRVLELSPAFESLERDLPKEIQDQLTMANTRARLRMLALYAHAGHHKMLVTGTGNKIEDFGVGFYTKYGDGGVDLSPIADLMKSQVYTLAKELGVIESILIAKPTDGLYADGKTDEDQLGATYDELEWAMQETGNSAPEITYSNRQKEIMKIYRQRNSANRHKMEPIPVCMIPKHLLL